MSEKRKWYKRPKVWAVIGAATLFVFIVGNIVDPPEDYSQGNQVEQEEGRSEEKPDAEAVYSAEAGIYTAVDPATIKVSVSVENTGDKPGTPSCTVRGSNEGGSYSGFDIFEAEEELQPGEEHHFNALITITNEGAQFVDNVSADCD